MAKKQKAQMSIVARVWRTLLATHFLPSTLVTAMTVALAYGAGQRSSLWLLTPAVLFGQFCIGWTNDYLDRDRDRIAGRTEKPIVSGAVRASTIRALAISALVAAVVFSLAYSVRATFVYIVALGSALLYDFRLKNSVLSIATFVVSFGLLPVYVAQGSSPAFMPNIWIVLALILWSIGIHIQNVIPDFEFDAKTGIKGAVNYLTTYSATLLTGVTLVLSVASLCVAFAQGASVFIWIIVGVFVVTALLFMKTFLTKKMDSAFKVSMIMTALASLLIMLSGANLR